MFNKLSYYLLFIYIFANTELHQLLKTSDFVGHYAQHKMEDSEMSFFEFIHLHYFSGGIKDSDYATDMKLPFKTNDFTEYRLSDQFFHFTIIEIIQPVFIYPEDLIAFHPTPNILHFPTDIWQPPRA